MKDVFNIFMNKFMKKKISYELILINENNEFKKINELTSKKNIYVIEPFINPVYHTFFVFSKIIYYSFSFSSEQQEEELLDMFLIKKIINLFENRNIILKNVIHSSFEYSKYPFSQNEFVKYLKGKYSSKIKIPKNELVRKEIKLLFVHVYNRKEETFLYEGFLDTESGLIYEEKELFPKGIATRNKFGHIVYHFTTEEMKVPMIYLLEL